MTCWLNSVLVLGVSWMHDSFPLTRCYVIPAVFGSCCRQRSESNKLLVCNVEWRRLCVTARGLRGRGECRDRKRIGFYPITRKCYPAGFCPGAATSCYIYFHSLSCNFALFFHFPFTLMLVYCSEVFWKKSCFNYVADVLNQTRALGNCILTYLNYSFLLRPSYSLSHFNYGGPFCPVGDLLQPSLNLYLP